MKKRHLYERILFLPLPIAAAYLSEIYQTNFRESMTLLVVPLLVYGLMITLQSRKFPKAEQARSKELNERYRYILVFVFVGASVGANYLFARYFGRNPASEQFGAFFSAFSLIAYDICIFRKQLKENEWTIN